MRRIFAIITTLFISTLVFAQQGQYQYQYRPPPRPAAAPKQPAHGGIGDLSEGMSAIVAAAGEALSYILLAAGIAFLFGALIKYMNHRANPSQVRLSEPLTMLVLGLALVALPFIQYVVGYNPGIF